MTETTTQHNAFETSGTSPPASLAPEKQKEKEGTALPEELRNQSRTTGLKLFDIFLYPILTNFIVFGMSVGVTYLTRHGGPRPDGSLPHGKWGEQLSKRNTGLIEFFEKRGLSNEHAKTGSMVFWSFFDGTLIAPLVKLFEDRREKIGKWIDDKLGTTPDDLSVYKAEPKQTWGTVIKGRLATAAIVLPTAIAFEKAGMHKGFEDWGIATDTYLGKNKPSLHRSLKNRLSDIPDFFRVSYFEAVYTTVCTAGLYLLSRAFARKHDEKTGRIERDPVSNQLVVHTPGHAHLTPQRDDTPERRDTPDTTVRDVKPVSRLHESTQATAMQA